MLALPAVVSAVGVKVAVRVRPLPLMAPSVPPVVTMSLAPKLAPGSSLKVKVMVAVWPALTALTSLLICRPGATVSTATLCVAWVAVVPAALLTSALMVLMPSAPKVLPATPADQLPLASTCAVMLELSARVMLTRRPASTLAVLPLISTAPAFSLALMASSTAMVAMLTVTALVLMLSSWLLMSLCVTPPAVLLTATSCVPLASGVAPFRSSCQLPVAML